MQAGLVGTRIKAKREELGLSQEALTRLLGFKDRQTLSAIETGERRVSAEELVRFADVLVAPLDWFTDPFLLVGEGKFSWRQTGVEPFKLNAYEKIAGRLIATFRVLAPELGAAPRVLRHRLGLTKTSRFEDAVAAAETFAAELRLGDVPALRLAELMERDLNILVLMVDPIEGISGAACRLPELDAVLINRNEAPGRRHYDLAHELFHILTWDSMPPAHSEDNRKVGKDRVEQLADSFASALLMPGAVLKRFGSWPELNGSALVAKLNATAAELGVTSLALKWRLVGAGLLTRSATDAVDERKLRNHGQGATAKACDLPPLFSKSFVALLARALDEGRLSARRAAGLLGLGVDDLEDLFAAHGVPANVGL
jgi:Zn-dependent peptidase ImmA (M78 family)/transcriptional regulator with XRE-family HTH domain